MKIWRTIALERDFVAIAFQRSEASNEPSEEGTYRKRDRWRTSIDISVRPTSLNDVHLLDLTDTVGNSLHCFFSWIERLPQRNQGHFIERRIASNQRSEQECRSKSWQAEVISCHDSILLFSHSYFDACSKNLLLSPSHYTSATDSYAVLSIP